jgi:hypothetical protein
LPAAGFFKHVAPASCALAFAARWRALAHLHPASVCDREDIALVEQKITLPTKNLLIVTMLPHIIRFPF